MGAVKKRAAVKTAQRRKTKAKKNDGREPVQRLGADAPFSMKRSMT